MEKNTLLYIKKISSLVKLKLDEYDTKFGVSTISCVVIDYVCFNEKKGKIVTQKDLEKEFYLSKSTCSDILSNLEEEEYLIRKVDEKDARKKNIIILPKGKELFLFDKQKFKDVNDDICSSLTKEEHKQLDEYLLRILKNSKRR